MSISNDLFRAILAMDSYNRGYNPGIALTGSQIGNATLALNSLDPAAGMPGGQAASFFAQAYSWNGATVISYRGTDQATPSWQNWTLGDIANGWLAALGFPGEAQARLAIQFYKSVAGAGVDPRTANIELTGHSLGEGLEVSADVLFS
jgi:hypothetical protein